MISVLPQPVAEALMKLNGDPFFETIKQWLKEEEMRIYRTNLLERNEAESNQKKGAGRVISQFLEYSENSREIVKKYHSGD